MIEDTQWQDFYWGSRKFQYVSDATGLPIDQVNFLLSQLIAILLAYIFRVMLHPKKVSATTRHWTAMSAGLCLSYFCFGKQMLLAFFLVLMCYCILLLCPPNIFHHVTLVSSIIFLSAIHITRQYYENGVFVIDITGPLMIIIQKVTSLAYSLHDGLVRKADKLTPLQKKFVVRRFPGPLEYFSYVLNFQSILAGPYFMFIDYQDFIEGTHYVKWEMTNKEQQKVNLEGDQSNNNCNSSQMTTCFHDPSSEPNPTKSSLVKLVVSIFCAIATIWLIPKFPIKYLTDPTFFTSSLIYKLFYIILATTMARFMYYTAWIMADAVCIMSGFGFNGYDSTGDSKWDLVSNVDIFGVEFGTSFKVTLESWNTGTMKWLRYLVYERAPFQKTVLTYMLSSLWHGFYPGYYLTFLGGAFFTIVSRTVRRCIRPSVVKLGDSVMRFYDMITFLATRFCLSYVTFPFLLLRFWSSVNVYMSIFWYLHAVGLVTHLLLPIVFPPLREKPKKVEDLMVRNGIGRNEGHQKLG